MRCQIAARRVPDTWSLAMEFRHERPRKRIEGILVIHSAAMWPLNWPVMIAAGSFSRGLSSTPGISDPLARRQGMARVESLQQGKRIT